MKVILTEDHDTLGAKGAVVEVKNGFGRNFLIPRRLAVLATPGAVKRVAEEAKQSAHKVAAQRQGLEALAARLSATSLTLTARAGDEGRLFGSVTAQQVADALTAKGLEVDRRKVSVPEIRTVGDYTATVRLAHDLTADVPVTVAAEATDEA